MSGTTLGRYCAAGRHARADARRSQPCTWGLSFQINEEATPQGRPARSLTWAGLANTYHWIDPVNRMSGVWVSQLFPFFHPTAIDGFRAFETAVYANL